MASGIHRPVRTSVSGPLSVAGTSDLVSGLFGRGNYQPLQSEGEESPSYDPTTGTVVLAATDIDQLLLVSPSNGSIQKWIDLSSAGTFLQAAVFDPFTNLTYAALWNTSGPSHIAAINDTTGSVVNSYRLGVSTIVTLALGEDGRILLAGATSGSGFSGSNTLFLFNASSGSFLPNSTSLGGNAFDPPSQAVYVPTSEEVFVAIPEQSQVVAVNLTNLSNPAIATTYSVSWPQSLTYDAAQNLVYAASGPYGSGGLLSINGSSGTIVVNNGSFPSVNTLSYDPANDTIATLATNGTLYVLSGASGNLTSTSVVESLPDVTWFYAYSLVFGTTGTMICGAAQGQILVIDLPNGTIAHDIWAGGLDPTAPTFDPANGQIYVADQGTGAPTAVVNATSGRETGFVYGATPFGTFYDSAIASPVLIRYDGLSVVNGTTERIVKNVTTAGPGPGSPSTATYDANSGYVFDIDSNATLVLNGTTFAPISSLPYWGTGLLAVPSLQRLYIFSGSSTVRVVNTTSLRIVTNVTLPGSCAPMMGAFDPTDREIYVAEEVCAAMSVLNTSTNSITTTISLPDWQAAVVYDPAAGGVIATDANALLSNFVFLVSDRNNSVVQSLTVGNYPYGETYDPLTGWMMVANEYGGTLSAVTASLPLTVTLAATPLVGQVGLAAQLFANATGGSVPYSFAYTGLPTGCASANTSVLDCTPTSSGTYAVSVNVTDRAGNWTTADLSWVVAEPLVITSFSATPSPIALGATTQFWVNTSGGYDGVTLVYVTLPTGCTDQNESPLPCTPTVAGVYSVEVRAVDGAGHRATANLTLTVDSAVVLEYEILFEPVGLPYCATWSVDFNGSEAISELLCPTTDIELVAPNGSYPYSVPSEPGYPPNVPGGTVVVDGSSQTVVVEFHAFLSAVNFTTATLPNGTAWTVTFNGSSVSSSGSEISFEDANGTYAYSVTPPAEYRAEPRYGNLSVAGAPRSVAITFLPPIVPGPTVYPIRFAGSSLPSGTSWSVTLNGTLGYGTSGAASFSEPNGSFDYTVGAPSGYTVAPSSGSVTVDGRPVTVALTFSANTTGVPPPNNSGGPSRPDTLLYVGVALVGVAALTGVVLWWRRRPPAAAPTETA
jgi:DNA-binding beta-propeller fold protein YncE